MPSDGRAFLDLFSGGHAGVPGAGSFSGAQIEQIQRTVGRVPEVMVKVTGGGKKVGAVAAHLSYISRKGELELETDEGLRVPKEGQKALLRDWHLELSAGQYRKPGPNSPGRTLKLVHNIVLSMPSPTPPDKMLAAARTFAREKFGVKHCYAMTLHTHQQHPHVHLVVSAEDYYGHRLHIDKALLREWRQDFARMMRDQGIAANATPRAVRGRTSRAAPQATYRARQRGGYAARRQLESITSELKKTGTIRDPARTKMLETRKAIISGWRGVAAVLEAQGEIALAADVHYFANRLPPVLTDRERLAAHLVRYAKSTREPRAQESERTR